MVHTATSLKTEQGGVGKYGAESFRMHPALPVFRREKQRETGKEERPAEMQVQEDQKHTLLTLEVGSAKHSQVEKQGARNSPSNSRRVRCQMQM